MYIQYKLDLKKLTGNQFEIIETQDNQPEILILDNPTIRVIKIQFQKNQEINMDLFITFEFHSKDITLETAVKSSTPILNDIINLLVYKLNVSILEPKINAYNTVDKCVAATGSMTIYNLNHYVLPELDYSWLTDSIFSTNLSQKLKISTHYQMYKSIILLENVTSRFLLLYSLLYEMKKGQKNLDIYIQTKEPEVEMIKSTNTSKWAPEWETIYTWWRNQSQHIQDDTSINETIAHYSKLVDALQHIVFQAILESLNLPIEFH